MRQYLFSWHHKVRLQLAVDGAIEILSSQFSFLDHCVGHFCVAAATLIERPGTLTQEFHLWKRCAKKWRRSSGADETSDRQNAGQIHREATHWADKVRRAVTGTRWRTNASGCPPTNQRKGPQHDNFVCSQCELRALVPLCPQRLAHAAGFSDFVDAPTPRRSFSFVRTASPQKPGFKELATSCPSTLLFLVCVSTRFSRPAGTLLAEPQLSR